MRTEKNERRGERRRRKRLHAWTAGKRRKMADNEWVWTIDKGKERRQEGRTVESEEERQARLHSGWQMKNKCGSH